MSGFMGRKATEAALEQLRPEIESHVLTGGKISEIVTCVHAIGETLTAILIGREEFLREAADIDPRVEVTLRQLLSEGAPEKLAVIGCVPPSHFELSWAELSVTLTGQGGAA